jgi:acetolactate synthase-1/2/3 large subunit
MSTNKLNGAQIIVDYLIRQKVPCVFGLCGHGNIQFIDALYGPVTRRDFTSTCS